MPTAPRAAVGWGPGGLATTHHDTSASVPRRWVSSQIVIRNSLPPLIVIRAQLFLRRRQILIEDIRACPSSVGESSDCDSEFTATSHLDLSDCDSGTAIFAPTPDMDSPIEDIMRAA